jgi:hypothetical protein
LDGAKSALFPTSAEGFNMAYGKSKKMGGSKKSYPMKAGSKKKQGSGSMAYKRKR